MFSTETLGKCTVIKIHNLLPKKLKATDIDSKLKDGFLFLASVGEKLLVYQNIGEEATGLEVSQLKKFISNWGGGERVEIRNGILEMELPSFLVPFHNRINEIPGCRVYPNLLRMDGDVYLCIEYHETASNEVSKAVMDFLSEDHIFEKELIYSGIQGGKLPYLLNIYRENGNSLGDFMVIRTVWEFRDGQEKTGNQGVFQNIGTYVPKCFVHDSTDKLIFRNAGHGTMGDAPHHLVDENRNIVEFDVKSRFYSDFYNEVIRNYSGPIFMHMEVQESRQVSYHVVERKQQNLFIKGLLGHWNRQSRKDHVNYIDMAQRLDMLIGNVGLE